MSAKIALVTGGARRLGRAIALQLARMGFQIALHYHHSQEMASQTASEIRELGVRCELIPADFLDEKQVATVIPTVLRLFSGLHLLINNASIFEPASLIETEATTLERALAIHVKAPFLLTRDFARSSLQGQIINILDSELELSQHQYFAYTLSKSALAEFTRKAAKELAPHIRVNAIAPGLTLPGEGQSRSEIKRLAKKTLRQKWGNVEEITRAVQFLVESEFTALF